MRTWVWRGSNSDTTRNSSGGDKGSSWCRRADLHLDVNHLTVQIAESNMAMCHLTVSLADWFNFYLTVSMAGSAGRPAGSNSAASPAWVDQVLRDQRVPVVDVRFWITWRDDSAVMVMMGIMMLTYENRAGGPDGRLAMAWSLFSLSLSVVEEPCKWIQVKPYQKNHPSRRTF